MDEDVSIALSHAVCGSLLQQSQETDMLANPGQVPSPPWASLSSSQPPPHSPQSPHWPQMPAGQGPLWELRGVWRVAELPPGLHWAGPGGVRPDPTSPTDTLGSGQEMWAPLQTSVTQTRCHHPRDFSFLSHRMRALSPLGAAVSIPGVLPGNMTGPPSVLSLFSSI